MPRLMVWSIPLLAALLVFQASAAAASSDPLVKTRTSCDMYGRCFDFSGPNDALVSDSSDLWHRADPLALAHGTIGEPVGDLEDE